MLAMFAAAAIALSSFGLHSLPMPARRRADAKWACASRLAARGRRSWPRCRGRWTYGGRHRRRTCADVRRDACVQAALFGVSPFDAPTLGPVVLVLAIVTLAAALPPGRARRSIRSRPFERNAK